MTKLHILAIAALTIAAATLAETANQSNKKPPEERAQTPVARPQTPQGVGRAGNQQGGGGDTGGRQFPPFNTEGSGLPQQPLIPGYQEDGIPQFNPYAAPQLGFSGYYPGLQPIQPIQPQPPQGYPGQPQIVYYSGTGQPFLVNPGNPPGNFLIPQFPQQPTDPNLFNAPPIYPPLTPQNPQGPPQPPVFVNGAYPKQPVIPPIDKDAEEIPKDISIQGSAANTPNKQKPQKIELDDAEEVEPAKPSGTPQGQPQPGLPNVPNLLNLRPGQRFFILNGQPLFSNYPGFAYQHPNLVPERYANPYIVRPEGAFPHPQQRPQRPSNSQQFKPIGGSLANIVLRNQPQLVRQHVVPEHLKGHNFPQQNDGLPITLQNQVVDKSLQSVLLAHSGPTKDGLQSRYYEKTIPFDEHQIPLQQDQVQPAFDAPPPNFDYYKYNDAADEAAIIIDAKYQEPNEVEDDVEGETEKPAESSVAEAQPGAIALAGDGGVAAAGPRGTALAGAGGLAVSSPHATAVAGPAKDDAPATTTEGKKKPATTKP